MEVGKRLGGSKWCVVVVVLGAAVAGWLPVSLSAWRDLGRHNLAAMRACV